MCKGCSLKKSVINHFVLLIFIFGLLGCGAISSGLVKERGSGLKEDDVPVGMVLIPAGEFIMGSTERDGLIGVEIGVDELPQHSVFLPAFFIDRYEVTNREFKAFREETDYPPSALLTKREFTDIYPIPEDNHPVLDVNWFDASAYCRWIGKRLPTEAEWEKAARGTDRRYWPWGNEPDPKKTNTRESGRYWTAPVGTHPMDISPYGGYDMAGNAMEWTDSWYDAYPGSTLNRTAFGKSFKVLKGASWGIEFSPFSRVSHRHSVLAQLAQPDFGFRCAKDEN